MAHDEDEVCEIGDKVRITMSRPISKRKVAIWLVCLFYRYPSPLFSFTLSSVYGAWIFVCLRGLLFDSLAVRFIGFFSSSSSIT